jgi:RHS repeat-associated protein
MDLTYQVGDQVSSVSLVIDENGNKQAEMRYLPFGQERLVEADLPTDHGFTNQRSEKGFGLMDYNARYYSSYLGRFISPDDIIPDPYNSLDWDRYQYVRSNPVKNNDPSGHCSVDEVLGGNCPEIQMMENAELAAQQPNGHPYTDPNNAPPMGEPAYFTSAPAEPVSPAAPSSPGTEPSVPNNPSIFQISEPEPSNPLIRLIRGDWVNTSQGFKLRKGEDGLSVFEGVTEEDVLNELPGGNVPNTTVIIPKDKLPSGTQVVKTDAPTLSQLLSDAHRILIPPEGWSIDKFAKAIKAIVGW